MLFLRFALLLNLSLTGQVLSTTLTILHVNDIHAHFEEVNRNTARCKGQEEDGCYGGMSRMSSFIKRVRQADPNALLLNAGDYYQGTIWYSLYKYKPVVQFSNLLNYTAMALGNHDWDDGPLGLQPFLDQVNFPVLAANIKADNVRGIAKSTVVKVEGREIGIIGYTIKETTSISQPGDQVEFFDEIESVRLEAKALKSRGVQIIIALGHAGYNLDMKMAAEIEELDLVVGGHSHTFLYSGRPPSNEVAQGPYPTYIEQRSGRVVPVVQAFCYTKYIGLLSLQFDENGEIRLPISFGQPILLDSTIQKDEEVEAKLDEWRKILKPFTTPITTNLRTLYKEDHTESSIGNLVADSMAAAWGGQSIALINEGGIRTGLEKGVVTGEDVFNVLPFNNTVDHGLISGADLLRVLEDGVKGLCPLQICQPNEFYQVSGLRVVYEIRQNNEGRRVSSLEYKTKDGRYIPLEADKTYPIVTVSFLLLSGKSPLAEVVKNKRVGPSDYKALADYLKKRNPVDARVEGRLTINYFKHADHLFFRG